MASAESMNTTTTCDNNDELEGLSQARLLKAIFGAKLMANILAALLLIVHRLPLIKGRRAIFHPNTRVIYAFFLACTLGIALSWILLFVFDFLRLSFPDACTRVWPMSLLLPLRLVSSTLSYGQDSALLLLCVERLLCVCRVHQYELNSRPRFVFALLLAMTSAISIPYGLLYTRGVSMDSISLTSSVRNAQNASSYQLSLCFMASVELLALVSLVFIHRWARCQRRLLRRAEFVNPSRIHQRLLSIKFQLEETLRVSAIFLPVTITKCATYQFALGSITLINSFFMPSSLASKMLVSEAVTIGYYQPLITALLLLHGHSQLGPLLALPRRILSQCFKGPTTTMGGGASGNNRIAPKVDSVVEVGRGGSRQEEHFRRLMDLFERGIEQ